MAWWRRWIFELRCPADEFLAALERNLLLRGVDVRPGQAFDLVVRAFGARAFVKVEWDDEGLALVVKLKSGLFASPKALEKVVLEAGREAQAELTYRVEGQLE